MDSAGKHEYYPNFENSSSPGLAYLFNVVEERFNEATKKQATNANSPYYVIEVVGDKTYYGMTLAKSYQDLITKINYSEKFEVLIPAIDVDTESPLVEQISGNPNATFLLRKNDKNNKPVYLDATTSGFKGSKKEIVRAYRQFFKEKVAKEDRVFELAELIRDYELIPSNVSPRYNLAEILLQNLGIKPTDA